MRFFTKSLLTAAAIVSLSGPLYAQEGDFATWLVAFKQEAQQQGISQALLDKAFLGISPNERVLELDQRQPEGTMTFDEYQERIVNETRIANGKALMAQHKSLLDRISKQYGVQPRFIVALWGIETNFGENTGGFSIVEALATLAFDGRRSEFFRKELINALKIIDQGHIALDDMSGSWAGALGQCQFMPSSFLSMAVDGNGDGKKDIWNNTADVFASIANYLAKSGWDNNAGWGREVSLPANFDRSLADRETTRSVTQWAAMGVKTDFGGPLPDSTEQASIIFPDDEEKRAFMVYDNYKVILKWNRSLYFATSVGILSDTLSGR